MLSRAHVVFEGKVQGVFFRAHTREFAVKTGVTGWVRNLPDGTVEAVFEGEKEAIEAAIKLCTEKQPIARVDKYSVKWEEYTGSFASFEIRR